MNVAEAPEIIKYEDDLPMFSLEEKYILYEGAQSLGKLEI